MDPQAQYESVFVQRFLCSLCGALLTDSKSCERHTSLVHGIKKCWLPPTTLVSNVCPNATYTKNGCRDLRLITGSEVTVETSNRDNKPSSLPNVTRREALQVSQISISEVSVEEKNSRSRSSNKSNKNTSSSNNDNSSDEDMTDTGFRNVPPLFKSIPDHGFYTLQRPQKMTYSKYCKKIGGKSIASVEHCDRSPNVEPFPLNCAKCDGSFQNIADFKMHVRKLCHFTGWYCYPCKERFMEFHQFWKHGCCHKAANSYAYKTMQFYYRDNKEIWECYVCRQLFFGKQVFYKHIVQCSINCKFCGCRFHNTDSFIAHDAGCRSYAFQVYSKSKSKSKSLFRNKSKSSSPNDEAKLKEIAGGCLIHCKYCAKPFTLQEMTLFDKHTAVCSLRSKGKQMTKTSTVKMPNAKKKTSVPKKTLKVYPGKRPPTAIGIEIGNRNQSDESDSDDSAREEANAQKLKRLRQTYFTWKEEREARLGKMRLNDNLKTRLVECEEEAVVEYCSLEDDEPPFKDTIMLDFLTETNSNAEQSKLTRIDKHSWHMRPKSKAAAYSVNTRDKIVNSSQFQPRCLVSKLTANATLNDSQTGSSTELIDEPDSGTCDIQISDVRSNVEFYLDGVDAQTGNMSGSEEFCLHLENLESGECDLSIVKEEYQSGSESPETSGQLDLCLVKVEREVPFEDKTVDSNVIDELDVTKKDEMSLSDEIRPIRPNPSFSYLKSNISSALASISVVLHTSQQKKKKKKILCTRCGHKVKLKHLDKHPCDQFLKRATNCFVLLRDISKEEYVKVSSPMRARLVKCEPMKIVISSKPLFADIQVDDVEASQQISKLESESNPFNQKKMKTEIKSETAEDAHVFSVMNDAKIKSETAEDAHVFSVMNDAKIQLADKLAAAGHSKVVVTKSEQVNEENDVPAQRPRPNAECLKRGISDGGSDHETMDASGVYVGKVPIRRSPRTKMPEWRHLCNVCGEKFFNDTVYRTHLRLHSDFYPFVCNMCGSCFQSEHRLNLHNRARNKNGLLSCDKCSIKFCSTRLLQQHAKLHLLKQS